MPRIPTDRDLGGPASIGERRVISGAQLGTAEAISRQGEMAGRTLQGLGKVAEGVGEDIEKQQNAFDLTRADSHVEKHLSELERSFAHDPNYPDFQLRYQPAAQTIVGDASQFIRSPEARNDWLRSRALPRIQAGRDHLLAHADKLQAQDHIDELNASLHNYYDGYMSARDEPHRVQIAKSAEDAIAAALHTSFITADHAEHLRAKYIDGMVKDDAERRALVEGKGFQVLRELESGSNPIFARLSPHDHHALITNLKVGLRAPTGLEVDDDITQMRELGGEPEKDASGQTALQRYKQVATDMEYTKKNEEFERAKLEYKMVGPLSGMTHQQASEHLDSKEFALKEGDPHLDRKAHARDYAARKWARMAIQRDRDPASAVESSPEVASANDFIERGLGVTNLSEADPETAQKAWAAKFNARVAAMRRLDIPSSKGDVPLLLTAREAEEFLRMPKQPTDDELTAGLMDAAKRAESTFGPQYAEAAFKAAVYQRYHSQHVHEAMTTAISQILHGEVEPHEAVPPAQGWWDRMTGAPAPSAPAPPPKLFSTPFDPWLQGSEPAQVTPMRNPTPIRQLPLPTKDHVKWLHQDLKANAAAFIRRYGKAAYDQAVKGKQP